MIRKSFKLNETAGLIVVYGQRSPKMDPLMLRKSNWILSFLLICSICSLALSDGSDVVTTSSGPVRGFRMKSRDGLEFQAFTKIPFAKPPVGDLRFAHPTPPEPWTEVYEANGQLPRCMQIPIYDPLRRDGIFGTVDCLYLSVFTPSTKGSRSVMVYMHGGGYRSGAPGNGPYTRSKYLMDFDVVLVMLNYRLGGLGFLSLEDETLPGNYGLKDQSAALRWVKENIASFGGDPNSITVFGESVGGVSSHYHLISPLSKDIVTRGISQSGVATSLWALNPPGMMKSKTLQLAESLGCPTGSSQEIVDCLKKVSPYDIFDAERQFNMFHYAPLIVYPPTIEPSTVEGAFLTDSPYNLEVKQPWIVGITSTEGAFYSVSMELDKENTEKSFNSLETFLPAAYQYDNSTDKADEVTKAILNKYDLTGPNKMKVMSDIFSDSYMKWPMKEALKKSTPNTWLYVFDHRGKFSYSDFFMKDGTDFGVSHTDDLLYLFNFEDEVPNMKTEKDQEVSRRLCKLWTDFAKTGKPTADDSWKPAGDDMSYLHIGTDKNEMMTNMYKEDIDWWLSLPLRDTMTAKGL